MVFALRGRNSFVRDETGQGTLEAALVLPILFGLMLLLIQPGIILYDRTIMNNAAAEGCRVLATQTGVLGDAAASSEAFVRHRLAAIPAQENFHVHNPTCSWEITFEGDERSSWVGVTIRHQVKPLPLIALGAGLLGATDDQGNITLEVTQRMQTQPEWAFARETAPSDWAGAWLS